MWVIQPTFRQGNSPKWGIGVWYPNGHFHAPSITVGERKIQMAKRGNVTTEQTAELVTTVSDPDHEEIAYLAYRYWQERGCPIGSPEEDWYRAENELRQSVVALGAAASA